MNIEPLLQIKNIVKFLTECSFLKKASRRVLKPSNDFMGGKLAGEFMAEKLGKNAKVI